MCVVVDGGLVTQPCPTVAIPSGSSVHGIFQARILGWVAISFSRGSSWHRDHTRTSCTGRWILPRSDEIGCLQADTAGDWQVDSLLSHQGNPNLPSFSTEMTNLPSFSTKNHLLQTNLFPPLILCFFQITPFERWPLHSTHPNFLSPFQILLAHWNLVPTILF